jgi:O-antigen chain-terminating methyltransferase
MVLKREFGRMPGQAVEGRDGGRDFSPAAAGTSVADHQADSWKYVGFENLFRGSSDEVRSRLQEYAPWFEGASDVLDVGCGRGEFLEILAARGIHARGIDLNHEMVEECRARGLDVSETDALSFLRAQPEQSLGGLLAAQVVEHFDPPYLLEFLDQSQRVLRPGSTMILETINVACWLAFFESYLRDITHARALHPDTLKYLVTASGFVDAEVQFKVPVAPPDRLQPTPAAAKGRDEALDAFGETFDGNVERINRLLFTSLDYAVIARRP